jgi:hypothetical protein
MKEKYIHQSTTRLLPADSISMSVSVARFNLQCTCNCLPHVGWAPWDIPHRQLQSREPQVPLLLPQCDVIPGSIISLQGAATEEVCGSVVEIGAVTQTFTAQLTGLLNWPTQNWTFWVNVCQITAGTGKLKTESNNYVFLTHTLSLLNNNRILNKIMSISH